MVATDTAPSTAPESESFKICLPSRASPSTLFVALSANFNPAFVAAPAPAAAAITPSDKPPVITAEPTTATAASPVAIFAIKLTELFCFSENPDIILSASS